MNEINIDGLLSVAYLLLLAGTMRAIRHHALTHTVVCQMTAHSFVPTRQTRGSRRPNTRQACLHSKLHNAHVRPATRLKTSLTSLPHAGVSLFSPKSRPSAMSRGMPRPTPRPIRETGILSSSLLPSSVALEGRVGHCDETDDAIGFGFEDEEALSPETASTLQDL